MNILQHHHQILKQELIYPGGVLRKVNMKIPHLKRYDAFGEPADDGILVLHHELIEYLKSKIETTGESYKVDFKYCMENLIRDLKEGR